MNRTTFRKCLFGILTGTFLGCSLSGNAVPAKPGLMLFDNGGKPVEVYLHGDENAHYYTSSDGYVLLRGGDDIFRYAIPAGGTLTASDITASNPADRTPGENALLASFRKEMALDILKASTAKKSIRRAGNRVAEESYLNTFPTKGEPRCLAILVEFQDVKFTLPDPQQLFSNMLNQEDFNEYGATGSVADYMKASSNGQFHPQFDVYGPVTLPYNMSYYGGNNTYGDDARPYEMVPHAVDLLRDQIDFSVYDNDDDGVVDNIYFFYAGYGEADGGPANSIWPHSWNVHDDLGMEIYMNGKLINHYATSNELSSGSGQQLAGIGVFCHEFSHVLGLPDLYSTTYTGTFTPDAWSLMDHGSYNNNSHTPPYHTCYERYCLGWVEPKLLDSPANITMRPMSQSDAYDDVYILPVGSTSEYYLFENRQQRGWDEYIPGHGLLVWHIDFVPDIWESNMVNVSKQYVDIVEADDLKTESSRSGDSFPGTAGVRDFTDDTTPSMRAWDGTPLYSPITGIMEADDVISFAFKGGMDIFGPIEATEPLEIKTASFTAAWKSVTAATGYILNVYKKVSENGAEKNEYLDGFRNRDVGNVTAFMVEGLDPETTYYYTVTATDGRFYSSESNEVEVTTLPPTLDYLAVTALAASDITDTSFRANWQPLDEAEDYEVCLYELALGEAFTATADFTDRQLPGGWESDGSYDGRGSYAVNTPSLRFTADGSYLTSGSLPGIRSLSFWYRAASVGDDAALVVSALTADGWAEVSVITPLVTEKEGGTVEIEEFPANAARIRIAFRRGESGTVSIDDVVVGYGGNMTYTPVAGKEAMTSAECSLLIDGLQPESNYGYAVTARNGEVRSKTSEIIGVMTKTAGLSGMQSDSARISVAGRLVTVSNPECAAVSLSTLDGQQLASGRDRTLRFAAPSAGVYIIRIGEKASKIVIK